VTSARTAERFGIEPRIAMLTYSSGPTGAGGDVERVRAAVEAVRANAPELVVDGPIRYDTAMGGGTDAPGGSRGPGRASVPGVPAAVEAVRANAPELVVDGPIRYDTAMGGGSDAPGGSPVAGRATVLVFPDLEVADGACQTMRTRSDATVYGPLLQGLRLPVN